MPLQRVMAGIAAALLFGLGVAAALADPLPTTTTDTTTASVPATSTAATTTTSPAPTATTTPVTTTAPLTQTTAGTTATTPTSTGAGAAATPAHELALARSCPLGGVVLLTPDRAPAVVGAIADGRTPNTHVDALLYPADGSIVTASSVALRERASATGQPTIGKAQLRDVSLLGGTVTAAGVTLHLGRTDSASITGLAVEGRHVSPGNDLHIPLHTWGYLVAGSPAPVRAPGGGETIAALSIHLLQTHAGLPAGTTILVAAAGERARPSTAATKARKHSRAASHHRKKHARATHEPLKVTPPLGQRHYIFPVADPSDYIDTYGAFRSDVPGNWHHGDDIFAPLGTPVVAVAGGTINRVGWEKLGGWRLWVRDSVGDEFYYAHLSGYAPTDLHSNRVKAGEVIGFIGNTGDAFTTSPHLHFEVHPRTLLHLGYDGAVDPTKYLDSWTHLKHVDAPHPIHPPLPDQPLIRNEARYVFRELLAARHLIKRAPNPGGRPRVPIPAGANGAPIAAPVPPPEAAPMTRTAKGMSDVTFALLVGLGVLAVFALTMTWAPLRRRLAGGAPAEGLGGAAHSSQPTRVAASRFRGQVEVIAKRLRRLGREPDSS